jgi:predicted CXXCH cytochrome family protein
MVALLKNKGAVQKIQGKVFKKDNAFAFHALLNLKTGLNEITVREKSLSVFYRPRYQYQPEDRSTGKKEVSQEYAPYSFHTAQKEATCSQCHGMGGTKAGSEPNCFGCHPKHFAVKYIHGPVGAGLAGLGGGACFVCHNPDSTPSSYVPKFDGDRELCFFCHHKWKEILKNTQLKAPFIHSAVRDLKCTACHDPHGTPFRFQLPVEEKRMCYLCHEQKKIAGGQVVHEALESEGCYGCHDTHTSDFKNQLLGLQKALCSKAGCHPEFAEINKDHPIQNHPVMGELGPGRRFSCSSCHNPHSSDFPRLLPGEFPSFCSKCHEEY